MTDLPTLKIFLSSPGDVAEERALAEFVFRRIADEVSDAANLTSLFGFATRELRAAATNERKLEILMSLGHACLAEHAQWILAHRDKRIQGMRW